MNFWHFFYEEESGIHLYHISLPQGVLTVDTCAFLGNALPIDAPDFVTPQNLRTVESAAFSGTGAEYVWLNEDIQSIGDDAFADSALLYVYIPGGCGAIGSGAFPAGTVILGGLTSQGGAGYAKTWAEQNGYEFVLLEP